MRPKKLEDIVGQKHIVGGGTPLSNLIKNKNMINCIFYGPPGVGKTTLANIISNYTDKKFYKINATTSSIKEIQSITSDIDNLLNFKGIILYIDELQHFNKKQQQALLEFIEDGRVILIASTTENPYFAIHKAILSRSTIFQFKPVSTEDIIIALERAVSKLEKEGYVISLEEGVLKYIGEISQGDVRKAYTVLELAIKSQEKDNILLNKEYVEKLGQSNLKSDSSGDDYYNLLSALQKSIRGSDPDASIHYLARLIKGGNMDSVIRRIGVIAAEDIGLAHPNALQVVNSGIDLALKIGMPEARIILSELVIYLATLPKSNSAYMAIDDALRDLERNNAGDVPKHLKDAHYSGASNLGVGGYLYPHNYPNSYINQEYMPENMRGKEYYKPKDNKYESSIKAYWNNVKNK
ncbi:replication-associated recombination protein A [Clostridium perfringens]|uniref:AAA family ATPase n=1 Tax=Clostridium perfringens TaxID=1502 RepID=A0AAW9I2F2_CLOPF|nr:replication-associated recombination protein A [Clostridium perfringens]MDK0568458.1 replication-associated recombination protein A [Clostridium perfringens]MDK0807434.1 replication-associated recombination protein A [Clostridium perfringens]MDK0906150.1 replication-associated recombination protein A [Clostridium perfringens]MDK0911729.1 replication-associated recombination protein A [Clostridium perfringens]MDK0949289.1 replication-associated recombination protein A [Clostridium perfringen